MTATYKLAINHKFYSAGYFGNSTMNCENEFVCVTLGSQFKLRIIALSELASICQPYKKYLGDDNEVLVRLTE